MTFYINPMLDYRESKPTHFMGKTIRGFAWSILFLAAVLLGGLIKELHPSPVIGGLTEYISSVEDGLTDFSQRIEKRVKSLEIRMNDNEMRIKSLKATSVPAKPKKVMIKPKGVSQPIPIPMERHYYPAFEE
jgi:hypothetical protein